jgi:hypothetical protein
MIQGLQYWSGSPGEKFLVKPASAFSRGDLLFLDSASSASGINVLMPSGADIFAVADCDSTQSINNLCLCTIPGPDTQWLASTHSATGSGMTVGQEFDFSYGVPNGRYFVTTSTDSVRAVIVRGTIGAMALDQSVHSQVVIRLIGHGGALEIS